VNILRVILHNPNFYHISFLFAHKMIVQIRLNSRVRIL
jgi:hypothetical protein